MSQQFDSCIHGAKVCKGAASVLSILTVLIDILAVDAGPYGYKSGVSDGVTPPEHGPFSESPLCEHWNASVIAKTGFALIRPDETHRFEAGNGVEDVDVLWCHKLCDNAKDCSAYGYYNRRGVQESSQHRNTRRIGAKCFLFNSVPKQRTQSFEPNAATGCSALGVLQSPKLCCHGMAGHKDGSGKQVGPRDLAKQKLELR